jgi:hypothetical protein
MSEFDEKSGENSTRGAGASDRKTPVGCVPGPGERGAPLPLPVCSQTEDADPFSSEEYAGAFKRPQRTIEYILGSSRRLARSVYDGGAPWRLAMMLLMVSLLAAIPYGIVSPRGDWWKIAALYCGSLAICFPSLHVFAQFFGVKLELLRSLALSMIITATAALFTFGFFPIIWFLNKSIVPGNDTVIRPQELSTFLLYTSLVLGLVQIARCLVAPGFRKAQRNASLGFLFILWTPLLIFITHRMAGLLELL